MKNKILLYLMSIPGSPVTVSEIRAFSAINNTASRNTVAKCVSRLVKSGQVVRIGDDDAIPYYRISESAKEAPMTNSTPETSASVVANS